MFLVQQFKNVGHLCQGGPRGRNKKRLIIYLGGGQPNSTQFMPMPILRFECGIGMNWHKLAHFFDSYICVCYMRTHANFTILAIFMMCFESNRSFWLYLIWFSRSCDFIFG